jgi:hypothetical protein
MVPRLTISSTVWARARPGSNQATSIKAVAANIFHDFIQTFPTLFACPVIA